MRPPMRPPAAPEPVTAASGAGVAPARATGLQRARVSLLRAAAWVACRLPDPVISTIARVGGAAWYRATPDRARQARRNMGRVVGHLAATGTASPTVVAAAGDPAALEALVREAYRQAVRYYLDMVRVSAGARLLPTRFSLETPDLVDRALRSDRPVALVGLHFGALELPTLYLAQRGQKRITVPMETLGDPALQAWLVETRSRAGVHIVGLSEARREMAGALARGEIIGLVGDRDLSGGGVLVPLFGVPAPLPVGPALMAMEADIPIFVGAVRRIAGGRWVGHLIEVEVSRDGNRRARLMATMGDIARAFEVLIAEAPEQWWTMFFPIWEDLAVPGRGRRMPKGSRTGTAGETAA